MHYIIPLHCTALFTITTLHTIAHCTDLHCTIPLHYPSLYYTAPLPCTVLYTFTAMHCAIILHCTALYYITALYRVNYTALYYTPALNCTVLYPRLGKKEPHQAQFFFFDFAPNFSLVPQFFYILKCKLEIT